ncbi:MAG TPA: hypothetical protein PLO23_10685 [Alphaproteobacteria bacterium]|nr:hypothetical protein [Alphaproteobacteria bacterium]
MIEAVNSVIASTQLVRNGAEQAASVRPNVAQNIAAQPTESAPIILAPYISPFVYVDNQFNKAVLQIRDSETGEVQRQFPSEETMRARAAAEAVVEAPQQQQTTNPATPQTQTLQSATLFAASQIGSETSAPQQASAPASAPSAPNVAQAQIASAALSAASAGSSAISTVSTSA